ncbi:rhamnogalacturonan acetylesterase [Paenibacillus dendrobii]|uniref:rhamnogalacturonan acetylesterase n=1 Tax=Paenibacillus dendrobii TaxID=2691084 RepID=UPI001F2EC11C|nr:rhamnogalacturonan acetylesterase [Paenibacillus dendrobii]
MMHRLFIVGDSTAARKEACKKPMAGWGEYLADYLDAPVSIINKAINGRSTKSFLAEGHWAAIEQELRAGDYVFIQFGHNDEKKEDPLRYTDPAHEYRRNLLHYIGTARRLGGIPVLLTPVSRRRFMNADVPDPLAVGLYPAAMRETAAETGTPLLDIFAASQQLLQMMGHEHSEQLFMHLPQGNHPNYPEGIADDTHFSEEGAQHIARLVAETIAQSAALSGLHPYLRAT